MFLGPLDDAWRLVPPKGTFPGGFASLCRQCDIGELVRGMAIFFVWQGKQRRQERPPRIFLIFQKVRFQPHRLLGGPRLQHGHDPVPTWQAFASNYEGLPFQLTHGGLKRKSPGLLKHRAFESDP